MRYDKHAGLYMPDLQPTERKELRQRAYELIGRVGAGVATEAERRELDSIGTTLYGEGSGWEGRAERDPRTAAVMRAALVGMRAAGVVSSQEAVAEGIGTDGFADARRR